jgi:Spy/CpxP family protein refolding chaperone
MSKQRTRFVGFVMLTALAVLAGTRVPARAQPGAYMHGPGAGRDDGAMLLPLLLRSANLTPEQDAKVRGLLAARRAASQAMVAQLRQAQEELADKLFAPGTVKEADLQPQLQKIAQVREQLMQESAKVALEVRALLTPEQLARAAQLKDRMRQLQSEIRQLWQSGKP